MKLKTYRAYTMAEALSAVKRDLGADAVIVQTRTFKQGGLLGIGRKTIVEVTATPHERRGRRGQQQAPVAKRPAPASNAARKAYAAAGMNAPSPKAPSQNAAPQQKVDALAEMLRKSLEEKTRERAAQRMVMPELTPAPVAAPTPVAVAPERPKPVAIESAPARFVPVEPSAPKQVIAPVIRAPKPATPAAEPKSRATSVAAPREGEPETAVPAAQVAKRFVLKSDALEESKDANDTKARSATLPLWNAETKPASATPVTPPAPERVPKTQAKPDAMQEEMTAIRKMVGQILDRQSVTTLRATPAMPKQLFDMYVRLIEQEMSEELADQVIREVERSLDPDQLDDEFTVRHAVLEQLRAFIPISKEPITVPLSGGPLRLALIGPTGVGKTTTLAKLAATFKLKQRRKVGLITSDTYRIAAVEQLRTYANIIGLRLEVALTPAEMAQACHALRDCDVILIDTAGRSQRDRDKLGELQKFLDAANPHEVHLVLSSTASEKVLMQEAEAFSDVRADKVILTKLDEAVSFGVLVNVMKKVGKELSFVTTGQEVPEHIEPGRANRLAELVLEGALNG